MQRTHKSNFNAKLALLFKQSRGAKRKRNPENINQLIDLNIYLGKNNELFSKTYYKSLLG